MVKLHVWRTLPDQIYVIGRSVAWLSGAGVPSSWHGLASRVAEAALYSGLKSGQIEKGSDILLIVR